MNARQHELEFLCASDILKHSISIINQSPKTLIFLFSSAVLAQSSYIHYMVPVISIVYSDDYVHTFPLTELVTLHVFYLLFIFTFCLFSTTVLVIVIVAVSSNPVSVSSRVSAVFINFLLIDLAIIVYHIMFAAIIIVLGQTFDIVLCEFVLFLGLAYTAAVCLLASLISILEPVYGLAAIGKTNEIIKVRAKRWMASVLAYFMNCVALSALVRCIVMHGEEYGGFSSVLIGGFCVSVAMTNNLAGCGVVCCRTI